MPQKFLKKGGETMSTGLIELFKDFHSQAVEGKYPASSRALYYFFVGELNKRYWATDELSYSERELADLVGLSKSTIHNAVKFLCDRNLIKTSHNKAKTKTFFKVLTAQSMLGRCWADVGQIVGSSESSNYAYAKDEKDVKDVKTSKEIKKESARAKNFEELDSNIRHAWIQSVGENPFGGFAEDLLNFQKRYGAEKVVQAIEYCRQHLQTEKVTIAQINGVLKGGNKRGKIVEFNQSGRISARVDDDTVWAIPDLPPGVTSRFEN